MPAKHLLLYMVLFGYSSSFSDIDKHHTIIHPYSNLQLELMQLFSGLPLLEILKLLLTQTKETKLVYSISS